MSFGNDIYLEAHWEGSYAYGKNWNISGIDINMWNSAYGISAKVNTQTGAKESDTQRLNFKVWSKRERPLPKKTECSTIRCPILLFGKIEIIAKRIHKSEKEETSIQRPDGIWKYKRIPRRGQNMGVIFDDIPDFNPDKTYQMKFYYKDSIRVHFIEKTDEIASQILPQESNPPILQIAIRGLDQFNSALVDFERMMTSTSYDTPMFDEIETSELQNMLKQVKEKLIEAKLNFDKAFESRIWPDIMAAQKALLQVMGK